MVLNATFNNMYWRRKEEYPEKTTDLSQATDSLSQNGVPSTPRH